MRRSVVVLVAVVLALISAAPALADDDLGLSWDGRQWSDSLAGELFDSSVRWVPGDTRTESFRVRNSGPSDANLAVVAKIPTDQGAGADILLDDLNVEARAGEGPWVSLNGRAQEQPLSVSQLDQGDEVEVDVRVAFDPASTDMTQSRSLDLGLSVRLTGVDAADPGTSDPDESDGGGDAGDLLPSTGAPAIARLLIFAAILIGIGLAFVRRRKEDDHG